MHPHPRFRQFPFIHHTYPLFTLELVLYHYQYKIQNLDNLHVFKTRLVERLQAAFAPRIPLFLSPLVRSFLSFLLSLSTRPPACNLAVLYHATMPTCARSRASLFSPPPCVSARFGHHDLVSTRFDLCFASSYQIRFRLLKYPILSLYWTVALLNFLAYQVIPCAYSVQIWVEGPFIHTATDFNAWQPKTLELSLVYRSFISSTNLPLLSLPMALTKRASLNPKTLSVILEVAHSTFLFSQSTMVSLRSW